MSGLWTSPSNLTELTHLSNDIAILSPPISNTLLSGRFLLFRFFFLSNPLLSCTCAHVTRQVKTYRRSLGRRKQPFQFHVSFHPSTFIGFACFHGNERRREQSTTSYFSSFVPCFLFSFHACSSDLHLLALGTRFNSCVTKTHDTRKTNGRRHATPVFQSVACRPLFCYAVLLYKFCR